MAQRSRVGMGDPRLDDGIVEELREKTMALVSVQRNYESISRLMQAKQQEVDQVHTLLAAEQSNVLSLRAQLEDCRARCTALEKQTEGSRALQSQLAELQASQEALKRDAAQANAWAMAMQETVKGLRQQLEEEQHRGQQLKHQVASWRQLESDLEGEAASLRSRLAESEGDCRAMASELRALRDALGRAVAAQQTEAQRAAQLTAQVVGHDDTIRGLQDEVRSLTQLSHELRSSCRASEVSLSAARSGSAVLEAQLRGAVRGAEVTRQVQEELGRQLAAGETREAEYKASLQSKDTELQQLRILLSDIEEKYQASLSRRMAADEVSTGLQLQLAQTRGALAEARRQQAAAEREAARSADEAADAARLAAARSASASRLVSAVQYRASEAAGVLAARMDAVSEHLTGRLAEKLARGLAGEAERVDRAITVTQLKLQGWESELVDVEAQLVGVGKAVEALSAAAVRRQAEKDREVHSVRGDAEALRNRLEEVAAALSGESEARKLLAASKAAAEAQHRKALQAAQAAADERVEAERQQLGARLEAVEAEVARMTRTHQRDLASAALAHEHERKQLSRRAEELAEELKRAKEEAPPQQTASQANALAVLHTQLNADLQSAREQYERSITLYKEQLEAVRANVRSTWSTCMKLSSDLALVAKHLQRTGAVPAAGHGSMPEGAGELPAALRGATEDGGGAALTQLAAALRQGFGQVVEGVQGVVRRMQVTQQRCEEMEAKVASVDPAAWSGVAAEVRRTVAQLVSLEDSLAPPCTCIMCLDVFKTPVTLIPCGHTFCRKCLAKANGLCSECGDDSPAVMTIANGPLDAICAKYELKRSALAAIQRALHQAGGGGGLGSGMGGAAAGGGHGGIGPGHHGVMTHGTPAYGSASQA